MGRGKSGKRMALHPVGSPHLPRGEIFQGRTVWLCHPGWEKIPSETKEAPWKTTNIYYAQLLTLRWRNIWSLRNAAINFFTIFTDVTTDHSNNGSPAITRGSHAACVMGPVRCPCLPGTESDARCPFAACEQAVA